MSRSCANWVLQALAQTSPPQRRAQQRGEEIELLSVSNYSSTCVLHGKEGNRRCTIIPYDNAFRVVEEQLPKIFWTGTCFLSTGGATRTKECSPRALRILTWWLWMLSSRTVILPSAVSIMFSHREYRAVLAPSSSISLIAIPAVAKGLHPCWIVTHLHQTDCREGKAA